MLGPCQDLGDTAVLHVRTFINEIRMLILPLAVNSWGIVNAYGTYASYYRQHLMPDANNTLLNLIGSTQCFCVLGLSIVVGRFIDAGYIRTLITIGSVLIILGQFLLTLATGAGDRGHGNYALIWTTQGLCTGLGMACYFVTSSAGTYPNLQGKSSS